MPEVQLFMLLERPLLSEDEDCRYCNLILFDSDPVRLVHIGE